MDKQIPIYFDAVITDSSLQDILNPNAGKSRLKVRAFTKYGNRNGSYITEEVAEQLINSATQGDTPVIGFFDPSTQTWASHTGPTLANGYGYVEDFLGWEPYQDSDGVTRDYAVFSVVLFTKYYEEANKIIGQNQSMELDINSIQGQWTEIDGAEYYVYSTAKILGFCVIGSHEPCFSVSAFFAKKDDDYENQYGKFNQLFIELKNNFTTQGGDQPMDTENLVVEQETIVEETPLAVEETTFAAEESVETSSEVPAAEPVVAENFEEATIESTEDAAVVEEEPVEATVLQSVFDALQTQFDELQDKYNALIDVVSAHEQTIAQLNNTIATYQSQVQFLETERKSNLINKYEKMISEEEISEIRSDFDNLTYEALESKLAIAFANKYVDKVEESVTQVPLLETPQESQFALLMKKYRKS